MSDIEKQVLEWRRGVMEKPRRGITRTEYIQQFLDLVRPRLYRQAVEVGGWQVRHARHLGPGRYRWAEAAWQPVGPGQRWGGEGLTGFFRTTFTVPADLTGGPLQLDLFLGGDGLLRVDGKPRAGLECFHREINLERRARPGRRYRLDMEICVDHQVTPGPVHTFQYARAVVLDREVEQFFWDFQAAFLAATNEWARPTTAAFLLEALEEAMLKCDPYAEREADFRRSLRAARACLKTRLDQAPESSRGELAILGHSHLDLVYLWDYQEFQRKILRTHTTQLMLMKEFPRWKFSQSQAVIYRDMRDLYPEVYRDIRQRVREGRWEVLGGMWVEPDCNLVSGESLVRQFLFGQHFFRQEFGRVCRVGWLPDVFGLPQTLPQIMKGCGLDYFYTAKLVWNDSNEWKTHLFWWESPDGSRVLTHTPPLHFIGTNDAPHVMKYWSLLGPKPEVQKGLYTYGWGDGGGGVERRMLLVADRYHNMPGVPRLRHQSALDYFCEQETRVSPRLPRWRSELYLETHRGTYTSAARLKQFNRQCEVLLREVEILSCRALLHGGRYERASLRRAWETVLHNQFHDILPGSHITKGFTDAVADYEKVVRLLEGVRTRAVRAQTAAAPGRKPVTLQVFNSLLWARTPTLTLTALPGCAPHGADGAPLPHQCIEEAGRSAWLVRCPEVPPLGTALISLRPPAGAVPRPGPLRVGARFLENEFVRVEINDAGEITSLVDRRTRRDYIPAGQVGNAFQMFEDNPGKYDAWDIARVYEKRRWDLRQTERIRVVEKGPLRVGLEITKGFSRSRLVQRLTLEAGRPWLDTRIEIDWHEDYRLLKLAFPVRVKAGHATYQIPYGYIERATGGGNRWERAKFEAPTLQWVDLSEATHGFSLINNCKHGHDVRGQVLRLTLLKASKYPNPRADRHAHTLDLRLFPHAGGWREGGTFEAAQEFNTPPTVQKDGRTATPWSSLLAWEGGAGVHLEALKQAEQGEDLVIRLREAYGRKAKGRLRFGFPVRGVRVANMLEDPEFGVPVRDGAVLLNLSPHQVVTLRVATG